MKPPKTIIIFGILIFIIVFLGYAYNVKITSDQYFGIIILFFSSVFILLMIFVITKLKVKKVEDKKTLDQAEKAAIKWWKENRGEDLDWVGGEGVVRYFSREPNKPHFGFLFHRSSGLKIGSALAVVLDHNLKIVYWMENIGGETLDDVFVRFNAGLKGSPVSDPIMENLMDYWKYQQKPSSQSPVNIEFGKTQIEWDDFLKKEKKK